jgi:hypothetical protein
MEFKRELRFLIPSFVFFATLLWGAVLDPSSELLERLAPTSSESKAVAQLVPLILAGGIAVVAMGFLISVIAILALRLIWLIPWIKGPGGYEANVSREAFPSLWKSVVRKGNPIEDDMLLAVAAFDHGRIQAGLHDWVARRWNTFMVCMNCIVAIGLAHFAALCSSLLAVPHTIPWIVMDLGLSVALAVNGFVARHQALGMLSFAATHQLEGPDQRDGAQANQRMEPTRRGS